MLRFCKRNERVSKRYGDRRMAGGPHLVKNVSAVGEPTPDAQSDSGALSARKVTEKAKRLPTCERMASCVRSINAHSKRSSRSDYFSKKQ